MVEQVKTKSEPRVRFRGFTDEWEEVKLGDVGKITTGSTPSTSISDYYSEDNSGLLWVTPTDISDSPVIRTTSKYLTSKGATKVRLLEPHSLLITCIASIGKNALLLEKGATNQQINALTAYADYDPYFLYTQSEKWTPKLKALAGTGTMEIINKTELSLFFTMTPSLDEQQRIGELFQTLDAVIDLSNTQVENLKQQKKALLQRLFPQKGETEPKVRLRGFTDEWEQVKLGDVLEKNTTKNKDERITNIESVSNKHGFISQSEQFENHRVASANLSNYYVVQQGMFAYNPSRINVGSIGYKDAFGDISVVSPLYEVFSTKERLDDSFFWYWLSTDVFESERINRTEGSVRDTLNYTSFSGIRALFPSLEEQQKIGELFQTLDAQISLAEDKVSQYKELKQALLQRLFV